MEGGKEKLARRIRGMWLWTFEILQALAYRSSSEKEELQHAIAQCVHYFSVKNLVILLVRNVQLATLACLGKKSLLKKTS